jgi:hypothetical protein
VGVDNVWEQDKLEARKMLENGDEFHTSTTPSQDVAIIFPERT